MRSIKWSPIERDQIEDGFWMDLYKVSIGGEDVFLNSVDIECIRNDTVMRSGVTLNGIHRQFYQDCLTDYNNK